MPPPYKILTVDDELVNHRLVHDGLSSRSKYLFAVAMNGEEAIEKVAIFQPDVILMDLEMPVLNGLDACRILKSDSRGKHIPIIVVTGMSQTESLVVALDAGADDFLSKPVNLVELQARVRSQLRVKSLVDDLQATLRMREDLSNMIAHDIRTPLSVILGISAVIKLSLKDPKYVELLQKIERSAHRVNGFLNDMLMVAKMKDGAFILHRQPIEITAFLQRVYDFYQELASSKGLILTLRLAADGITVSADENLLSRVLDNLISNAVKFSPPGGTITIGFSSAIPRAGDAEGTRRCRITVADEGCGIPESNRKSIFEKFRGAGYDKKLLSIGLGLAFCKLVVEAHGGAIAVEDNVPRGSVFVVEI